MNQPAMTALQTSNLAAGCGGVFENDFSLLGGLRNGNDYSKAS
jgi:hypothetical protein